MAATGTDRLISSFDLFGLFVDPFPFRLSLTVSLFDCHTSNPCAHIRLGNLPGANHAARFHEIKFILRKLRGVFIRPFVFIAPLRAVYHRHAPPPPLLTRDAHSVPYCRLSSGSNSNYTTRTVG